MWPSFHIRIRMSCIIGGGDGDGDGDCDRDVLVIVTYLGCSSSAKCLSPVLNGPSGASTYVMI